MPIENLDNVIDTLNEQISIISDTCGLKHSEYDPAENHEAVDCLCQKFISGEEVFSVRVPICEECVHALLGKDWIILFCMQCCSSQWVCKRLAKRKYEDWENVVWMKSCPNCFEVQ